MTFDFLTNQDELFTDVFYQIQEAKTRFVLVRGGASSSKSVSAHQLEMMNLMDKKHHTLIIKKEASTLYDSCYELLKQIAEEWKIKSLFTWVFSNAKREIKNKKTGRKILFKGIDDPEKIKSIVGIDRIIIEEASDLTEKDFRELNRRVRGIENIQIILIFNPISELHWLKKFFYDDVPGRENTYKKKSTFINVTYKDNPFLTEDDIEEIENLQYSSPNDYRIYALNQWGKPNVQNPFAENFNIEVHVSDRARQLRNLPVNLVWDFNVDPIVCLANHEFWHRGFHHVWWFKEFAIEKSGSVQKMIKLLQSTFAEDEIARIVIMGDAMQQKREITQEDNRNAYQMIVSAFNVSKARFKVPKFNPLVSDSRHELNFILAKHRDYIFHSSMKRTINELLYTEATTEGKITKIIKKNRNNENQRSDCLDCVRYFNNVVLFKFIKRWKKFCGVNK